MNELKKLKQLVLQSQDLKEPLNYFFDLMDKNKIISVEGHQVIENINHHIELLTIMDILKSQIFNHLGVTIRELRPLFYEISEYHFIHGACFSKESFLPITIIYFSDVKTGIFAVASMKTDMFRFSLIKTSEIKNLH